MGADLNERDALIARFDALRDSGVCSPTTRDLLDEAERLLRQQVTPGPAWLAWQPWSTERASVVIDTDSLGPATDIDGNAILEEVAA